MCSLKRSPRNLGRLLPLACLAAVLGFSIPGCSGGGGPVTLSPEDKAKAKEAFQRKVQDFGGRDNPKGSR